MVFHCLCRVGLEVMVTEEGVSGILSLEFGQCTQYVASFTLDRNDLKRLAFRH